MMTMCNTKVRHPKSSDMETVDSGISVLSSMQTVDLMQTLHLMPTLAPKANANTNQNIRLI